MRFHLHVPFAAGDALHLTVIIAVLVIALIIAAMGVEIILGNDSGARDNTRQLIMVPSPR